MAGIPRARSGEAVAATLGRVRAPTGCGARASRRRRDGGAREGTGGEAGTAWRRDEVLWVRITEKEEMKTRKRNGHSNVSAREWRLERENEKLKRENNGYRELVRVVRAMAANNGMDYDALVQETAPGLATSESMVGLSRKHDTVNQEGTEQGSLQEIPCKPTDHINSSDKHSSRKLGAGPSSLSEVGFSKDKCNIGRDEAELDNNDDAGYGYESNDDYNKGAEDYGHKDDNDYDNDGGDYVYDYYEDFENGDGAYYGNDRGDNYDL